MSAMDSLVVNLLHIGAPKVSQLKWPKQNHITKKHIYIYIPTTQVLVAVALMTSWCTNLPPICPRFDFLDLFAGCAQASKTWHLSKTYVASTWG